MTYETQERIRMLAPGGFGLVYTALGAYVLLGIDLRSILPLSILSAMASIIGAVYGSYRIRERMTKPDYHETNGNIASRLALACGYAVERDAPGVFETLKFDFYAIIDNDPSLTLLSKRIRGAGTIWTTWADLVLVSAPFAFVFIILGLVGFGTRSFIAGLAALAIGLLFAVFYRRAVAKHRRLIDEQIDGMLTRFSSQVCSAVARAATRNPNLVQAAP